MFKHLTKLLDMQSTPITITVGVYVHTYIADRKCIDECRIAIAVINTSANGATEGVKCVFIFSTARQIASKCIPATYEPADHP